VYHSTLTQGLSRTTVSPVLAAELKKARLAAGLTQEELAAKANVSREYVNYVERGKRQPTVVMFVRLCKAMKIHAPEVLARAIKR
jgi:transcriptional regulator with XRE-family HTH domain